MGAITMSRVVATLAALSLTGACNDTSGPGGQLGEPGRGGMTVVPRFATIEAGQTIQLSARLIDDFGDPIEGLTFTWTSSNESVAIVSHRGAVMGRGEGRAAITARADGRVQSSAVQVLRRNPPPKYDQ